MQTEQQKQGQKGELLASSYLLKNGYKILDTNWRVMHLEVDIIAEGEGVLVFVEVKTRSSNSFGEPEEFVGILKQRNLIRAADIYLRRTGIQREVRFDIISVIKNGDMECVRHIKDAFKPRW